MTLSGSGHPTKMDETTWKELITMPQRIQRALAEGAAGLFVKEFVHVETESKMYTSGLKGLVSEEKPLL